mmetsp:Transcript_29308/g.49293  ORF Transcript_29308/g.49293 Transcript_29308/m.49293 type:complete len:245 (-) Transcript_29308:144-878(-)|eukprot:CAMPEP_0184644436 /NCGR_PEP_ID=MMETSP0308-20130426/1155_1 /TAXON_ID=38269 /ORGANISM="Gloeochaete witrockiana, Strain SAG 46.84" /LENGTH=244 /DNA_ID=CAMNT_0027072965 /DNA_START=79 /DNA_END=813 /DNA_ORIENTATION=-
MRRPAGIAGLQQQNQQRAQFKAVGDVIASDQLKNMQGQLAQFRQSLEEFASKHKSQINKNPEFRLQFHKMCAAVGVDPLASGKGFWAEVLGVGDFYYELGVQIIQLCLATRTANGGLMELNELCKLLSKVRSRSAQSISQDDVERSIRKLKVLGSGFDILTVGNKHLVRSVPIEVNTDHTSVLVLAQSRKGCVTKSEVEKELSWGQERTELALGFLLQEGMAWIDSQASEVEYWFPCLFEGSIG